MKHWIVTRIIREVYDVEAETREEVQDLIMDPHTVIVVKETIKGDRQWDRQHPQLRRKAK